MAGTTRREAILAVSSRLFAEKGYANTTTSGIAREAGVAEGTLYHHFGGKDDIFLTILNETMDGYLEGMDEAARGPGNGRALLSRLIRFHFDYVGDRASGFRIVFREVPAHMNERPCAKLAEARRKMGRLTTLLEEVLRKGEKDGSLRATAPAGDLAEMLGGLLYGNTRLQVLGTIAVPLPRLARILEDFCLNALAAPARAGRSETEETFA